MRLFRLFAAALLAAGLAFASGADSFARSGASSGFHKPPSSSGFSTNHDSRGWGSSRPSGTMDGTVSRGMAKDSLDSFEHKSQPPAPDVAAPARPYTPPSYGSGNPQNNYAPAPSYPRYGGNSGGDFGNGMLVGQLIDRLLAPRPTYADDSYYRDTQATRTRLQDIANSTTDPDLKARIETKLHESEVSNPIPIGAASQNYTPIASTAQESHSHWLLWLILLVIVGGGIAYYLTTRATSSGSGSGDSVDASFQKAVATAKDPHVQTVQRFFKVGGRIKLGGSAFVIASAQGSDVPDLTGAASISKVGHYELYGTKVERAYFKDGDAFVERAVDPRHPDKPQMRVYSKSVERTPNDDDDWNDFIGDDGVIGQSSVTVPPNDRAYLRVWGEGDGRVKPVVFDETVVDASGGGEMVSHKAMQYARALSQGANPLYEFMYIGVVKDSDGASVKLWVGLDVANTDIEIA